MTLLRPWEGTIVKNKLRRPMNATFDDQGYDNVYEHKAEDGDSQKTSRTTYRER